MIQLKKSIHQVISEEIPQNSRVLDLGCGDGELLNYLIKTKNIHAHGLEINSSAIIKCVEKGISVIHRNLNNLPLDFPDKSYDMTILNQTITEVQKPKKIIMEMLRIGKEGILGFSNFGSLNTRASFLFRGRMPVTTELPYKWYNTPNIHLLTIKDFTDFCNYNKIEIMKKVFLKRKIFSDKYKKILFFRNMRADLAVFRIRKNG
jgi:methionine biosynthesis protein MetW